MTKKIVIFIGTIICISLVAGIVLLNKSGKGPITPDNTADESLDIEKEDKKVNIPVIKVNDNIDKPEDKELENEIDNEDDKNKETIGERDDNKPKVNPIAKPKKERLPEEMEKPITEPKPIEPPKPIDKEIKDKEKPPTTKKEEPEKVKGGTDSDGVVRDLKGNPTGLKPAENVEEIKGSDLLPPGEKMGEGDKF